MAEERNHVCESIWIKKPKHNWEHYGNLAQIIFKFCI